MNAAKILDYAENIRDLLDMHCNESCGLVATKGVALNALDDIALLISVEVDNICRECTPSTEHQLDLLQEQPA
jgi:hypothetical protein